MKVKPKQLLFSSLPKAKKGKKVKKYEVGGPGPKIPGLKRSLTTLPDDYFDIFQQPSKVQDPVDLTPAPDTSKIKLPEVPMTPPGMRQPPPPSLGNKGMNPGQAALLGLSAFDAVLPDWYPKYTPAQPQMGYNPYLYGTGSQALAEYGGYIKDDGNTPSAQSGRSVKARYTIPNTQTLGFEDLDIDRPPIITHNPNDPRLQRYADSMTLHNATMGRLPKFLNRQYGENWASDTQAEVDAYRRLGAPQPVHYSSRKIPYSPTNPSRQDIGLNVFMKPVQPYIYQPMDRDIDATQVQRTDMTTRGSVQGTGLRPADLSQKPTKYSVTVRDENAPGKQRSIYFKDKKSWRDFMDAGAINAISSSEMEDSATAAGYSNFEYGGEIPTAEGGKWIQKAINPKHKGYCTPMTKKTCTPRRKALAKTLKKMAKNRKHADGGIIPDNMSVFYPAKYEHGGNVNGGADIRMVGARYPNADLLEQWLLYENGGQVNWDGNTFRQVPARYPNTDLLEQWVQYNDGGQLNWNGTEFRQVPARYPNTDLLEQWLQYKKGGTVNTTGYRDGGPTAGNPYNIIPTGDISMQGVSQPIMARPITDGLIGMEQVMLPGQEYNFNSDAVLEYPMARAGLSAAKAKEMLKDGTANGKKLTKKQKRYFGMVAAGKAQTGTQVSQPLDFSQGSTTYAPESFYQASAKLAHYKNQLNEKLKAKNPQAFGDYFKGLVGLRRSGDTTGAQKYVQDTPYEEYLSPQEVEQTLGADHYNEYLSALRDVNAYNVQQGQQPLFGTKEGAGDLRTLNYGRRFASLQVRPSLGVGNTTTGASYNRDYTYDPATRQVSFTEKGDIKLRPAHLSTAPAPIATSTASLKKGGVVYDDGGQIGTMWGGSSKLASYNPYDGGTIEFQGASHDNGGIGMHYNGTPVEVEGGEFAAQDPEGNLNIFGNMYLPGTRTKFKTVAKEIAKKEKSYDKLKTNGSKYVNEANPANKFERLKFNSGMVMMQGGEMGQRDLAQKKENLSALQKAMLDTADEFGLDAEKMSQGRVAKAKKGKQVKKKGYYQAGGVVNDPTMADRNNNPGNIKWGKFAKQMGAKKGPPAPDGGHFAVFDTRAKGLNAMDRLLTSKSYKDLDVDAAISKWTGGHPYRYDLSSLKGKKISQLTPEERQQMMDVMQIGEGTRYGPGAVNPPVATPNGPVIPRFGLPDVPAFTPNPQRPRPGTVQPPYDELNPPPDPGPIPSNVEPLHINQLLGEIYSAATNSVEPVPTQRYEPQLFQPYQVSFQDRLNMNQNSFNALRRAVGPQNASALGELAAQKYAADTNVKADEFRTNQGIANEVTNKNVALLNDANLKNLALADTQMVRQSQARSNTRATDQMIVNSLSSKFMQNRYENKRLAAYENLYDYRFVPQEDGGQKATYFGPNAMFNFSGSRSQGQSPDVRTVTRYDQYGNVKGVTEYDDFDLREMQRAIDLEMKKRNLPLMTVPPLNKKGG